MRGQLQRGLVAPGAAPAGAAARAGRSLFWENLSTTAMEGVWILPPAGKPYSLLRENHSIEVFPQEGCNYL